MDWLLPVSWHDVFVPDTPLLEIFVRGSIVYLSLFFLLRFILKRQAGAVGISDLLVIVLVADAAQNGMAGDSKSITEALLLIVVIVLWDFFLDWLGFKSAFVGRILEPKPLLLIKDGKVIKKNLEKEFITDDELTSQLRQQGIAELSKIDECYLESNGRFSVLTRKKEKKGG